jgi:hypothetical protein
VLLFSNSGSIGHYLCRDCYCYKVSCAPCSVLLKVAIEFFFFNFFFFVSPRLPTFGLKNSSHNQSNGTIKTPTPAFGSDWGSGMSSSTYDQQNISGIYTAGEHPMQPPDSYQAKRYQSPTTNVALNIIQYHKDNFIRSEERMIGNIPRRADSRSSHSELIG